MRRLSKGAIAKLTGHSWPGNVRQLENAIRQALFRATGVNRSRGSRPRRAPLGVPLRQDGAGPHVQRGPRALDPRVPGKSPGKGTGEHQRAEMAGKHRSELYELLNRFAIDPARFRPQAGSARRDSDRRLAVDLRRTRQRPSP
jgi:DNA-binding NtrC family response regulator